MEGKRSLPEDNVSNGVPSNAINRSSSYVSIPEEILNLDECELSYRLIHCDDDLRMQTIENLILIVRRNVGLFPYGVPETIFSGFHAVLDQSVDHKVRHKALQLLSEVIPCFGEKIDECVGIVLPRLISNIGEEGHGSIRRAVVQTLHQYLKHSQDRERVLNALAQLGLQHKDASVRREILLSTPLLFTKELARENFLSVVLTIGNLLHDNPHDLSFKQVCHLALKTIQELVGMIPFQSYLQKIPSKLLQGYRQPVEQLDESLAAQRARMEEVEAFQRLSLLLPPHLMESINQSDDWRRRVRGIEKIKLIIGSLPDSTTDEDPRNTLLPYISFFYEMLAQCNFQIITATLEAMLVLINKFGKKLLPYLKPLVLAFSRSVGDHRVLIRQIIMRIVMKLMYCCHCQPVVEALVENMNCGDSRIRQEAINFIIAGILTYQGDEFDLDYLNAFLAPALDAQEMEVRQAAMECVTLLAAMSRRKFLHSLRRTMTWRQNKVMYSLLKTAIDTRIELNKYPTLGSNGLVEYASSHATVFSYGNHHNTHESSADIDWVVDPSDELLTMVGIDPVRFHHLTLNAQNMFEEDPEETEETGGTPLDRAEEDLEETEETGGTPLDRAEEDLEETEETGGTPLDRAEEDLEETEETGGTLLDRAEEDLEETEETGGTLLDRAETLMKETQLKDDEGEARSEADDHVEEDGDATKVSKEDPVCLKEDGEEQDENQSHREKNEIIKEEQGQGEGHQPHPTPQNTSIVAEGHGDGNSKADNSQGMRGNTATVNMPVSFILNIYTPAKDNDGVPTLREITAYPLVPKMPQAQRQGQDLDDLSAVTKRVISLLMNQVTQEKEEDSPSTCFEEEELPSQCVLPPQVQDHVEQPSAIKKPVSFEMKRDTAEEEADAPNSSLEGKKALGQQKLPPQVPDPVEQPVERKKPVSLKVNLDTSEQEGNAHDTSLEEKKPPVQCKSSPQVPDPAEQPEEAKQAVSFVVSWDETEQEGSGPSTDQPKWPLQTKKKAKQIKSVPHRFQQKKPQREMPTYVCWSNPFQSLEDLEEIIVGDDFSGCPSTSPATSKVPSPSTLEISPQDSNEPSVPAPDRPSTSSKSPEEPKAYLKAKAPRKSKPIKIPPDLNDQASVHAKSQPSTSLKDPEEPKFKENKQNSIKNPMAYLDKIKTNMQSDDWEKNIEGLRMIQEFVECCPDVCCGQELHKLFTVVTDQVQNLRSKVSSLAINVLGHLFTIRPKDMEKEADTGIVMLLEKSAEAKTFLRDAVEAALFDICIAIPASRVVPTLATKGVTHRNPLARVLTAKGLELITDETGFEGLLSGPKNVAFQFVPAVSRLALDSAEHARGPARNILRTMLTEPDLDEILEQNLDARTLRDIQSILAKMKKGTSREAPARSNARISRPAPPKKRRSLPLKKSKREDKDDDSKTNMRATQQVKKLDQKPRDNRGKPVIPPADLARDIIEDLGSKDWEVCVAAMDNLQELCLSNPDIVGNLILRIFDKFAPCLHDIRGKVNFKALEVMLVITEPLQDYLHKVINMVVVNVAPNLNSKNKEFSTLADRLMLELQEHLDPAILVQPFGREALQANHCSKHHLVDYMTALAVMLYSTKPKLVQMNILPLLWQCLDIPGPPAKLKKSISNLVYNLDFLMGDELVEKAAHAEGSNERRMMTLTAYINEV